MTIPADTVNLALFCDFENIALGVRDARYEKFDIKRVLERLLLKGSIVVKKAYCDWDRYKEFKPAMHHAGFELIEIPHVKQSGKNSADIRMVVDALDLCYSKTHIQTFVIVSGDSDFSPLVAKLRENNKDVIGLGVKNSTSDLLIASCDEFIYYDDLVREQKGRARAPRRRAPAAAGGRRNSSAAGAKNVFADGKGAGAGRDSTEATDAQDDANGGRRAGAGKDASGATGAQDDRDANGGRRAGAGKDANDGSDFADAGGGKGASAGNDNGRDAGEARDSGDASDSRRARKDADSDDDKQQEAFDLVLETIDALIAERGGDEKIWGSMVKQALKRRRPGFNERYYGFRSFNDLLEDAASRRLLTLERDEKSGGYVIRSGPEAG